MADQQRDHSHDDETPRVSDKRRIDPVTGEVRGSGQAPTGAGAQAPAPAGGPAAGEPAEGAPAGAEPAQPAEAPQASAEPASAEPASDGQPQGGAEGAGEEPAFSDDDLEKLLSGEGAEDAPVEGEAPAEGAMPPAAERSPEAELAEERLRDLQRIQAEYANYRRRTEREREVAADRTTGDVLASLFPVLDDLDRAEQHGDLGEGTPLAVIAGKLRATIERHGVVPFGAAGEAFDPQRHEAIAQLPNPEVQGETIADVVQRGYALGERVIRPAKVAVFVPAS